MSSILDIAKYILEIKGSMNSWKLQKLCYYSQAWALAWEGTPLFNEDFQAWANGPVSPKLYQAYHGNPSVNASDIPDGSADNLTEEQKEDIDIILRDYGDMDPYELKELSHYEAPWKEARGSLPEGAECKAVIERSRMREYYGRLWLESMGMNKEQGE